jgi:hypothetical protein
MNALARREFGFGHDSACNQSGEQQSGNNLLHVFSFHFDGKEFLRNPQTTKTSR